MAFSTEGLFIAQLEALTGGLLQKKQFQTLYLNNIENAMVYLLSA